LKGEERAVLGVEGHTMTAKLEIQVLRCLDIDDTEEALISSLELALVKNLNCNNGSIFDRTAG
jgi:hypothetical protein